MQPVLTTVPAAAESAVVVVTKVGSVVATAPVVPTAAPATSSVDYSAVSQMLITALATGRNLQIQNLTDRDLYLGFGIAAVLLVGIKLAPGVMWESPVGAPVISAVYGIGAAGGTAGLKIVIVAF